MRWTSKFSLSLFHALFLAMAIIIIIESFDSFYILLFFPCNNQHSSFFRSLILHEQSIKILLKALYVHSFDEDHHHNHGDDDDDENMPKIFIYSSTYKSYLSYFKWFENNKANSMYKVFISGFFFSLSPSPLFSLINFLFL